jgi:peptidoglycan hydrolase CwlO-like protein
MMGQGNGGQADAPTFDPRAEHSAEEWAKFAAMKADAADNRSAELYQRLGGLLAEVSRLAEQVSILNKGQRSILRKLGETEQALEDLDGEIEDSKVTALRKENASLKGTRRAWKNASIGLGIATLSLIIGGAVLHFLHWAP